MHFEYIKGHRLDIEIILWFIVFEDVWFFFFFMFFLSLLTTWSSCHGPQKMVPILRTYPSQVPLNSLILEAQHLNIRIIAM